MNGDFPIGRYSTNTINEAFLRADKTKRVLLLENTDPYFSFEIEGFDTVDNKVFLDILSHIEAFDNKVQSFCETNYQSTKLTIANYIVSISWIIVKPNEVVIGYWGDSVNIELRAIFTRESHAWEVRDIYFQ